MKKNKVSRIITVVIIFLIVFFGGLCAVTFFGNNDSRNAPASGGQAGGAGQGQTGQQRPAGGQSQSGQQQAGGRNATIVRITPVTEGTIENSILINGDILARSQVAIYPTVAGKLTEARLRVGDRVQRGQIVAMVDPARPGEVYSQSPVIATTSGTVLEAPVYPGDTLTVQTAVYVVGDISNLVVETFVPERFTTAVRAGLGAEVYMEALPGESFAAVVEEVSPALDPASRTLRIRLRFTRQDSRIRAGMFAMVSLVTNTRRNVPVIPRNAVINTYGSWIVFTVNERNIAERHEITIGIENEEIIEVLSGLTLGDRVVSAGQNFLTDGDLVRIVE
ncbi:MAG: efflux RND transporter periplasmic adaptor subunit [Treponema sp.]|nr:efflux RND transporter periplasmic adaptor subunit [Treponema sp.]